MICGKTLDDDRAAAAVCTDCLRKGPEDTVFAVASGGGMNWERDYSGGGTSTFPQTPVTATHTVLLRFVTHIQKLQLNENVNNGKSFRNRKIHAA